MHREGHVGAALAVYAPVGFVAYVVGAHQLAVLGAVAAVALAMLPDQDQRAPLIKHRGITHTVWFALLVGIVLAIAGGWFTSDRGLLGLAVGAGFGFLVGVLTVGSHIAADALTPMGVTPLAPVRTTSYSAGVAKAANPLANYVLLVLGGGLAFGALVLASMLV